MTARDRAPAGHPVEEARARELPPPMTVIEEVRPQVEGGRYEVKRVWGEDVVVTAACFAHGGKCGAGIQSRHHRYSCLARDVAVCVNKTRCDLGAADVHTDDLWLTH